MKKAVLLSIKAYFDIITIAHKSKGGRSYT